MTETSRRKSEHLQICLEKDVRSLRNTGFSNIQLPHRALPEISLDEVDLSCRFLEWQFSAPLLISSMTGGNQEAFEINRRLARLAQARSIPMGVGSQRVALESKESNNDFSRIRKENPNAVFFANIGAVQLNYGVQNEDCLWLVDNLQAQALILHLNPLQEAIQLRGDGNFQKLLPKIESLRKALSCPLIVKETGCGMDPHSAIHLQECGVDAIDVAGLGGSHWGFIEGLRHSKRRLLGDRFRDWGIPTAESLLLLRDTLPANYPLIGSGGIRNGLDIVKALYLGANMGAMAMGFLQAAKKGEEELNQFFELEIESMRIALFCCGWKSLRDVGGHEKK